jgi:hypothetical protein
MTAWTPDGPTAAMFQIARRYAPPGPEGLPAPEEWGDEETARERLDGLAGTLDLERRMVPWGAPSAEALWDVLDGSAPTQIALKRSLEPERYAEMRGEFIEHAKRFNSANDGSIRIDSEYLLIVARKRG